MTVHASAKTPEVTLSKFLGPMVRTRLFDRSKIYQWAYCVAGTTTNVFLLENPDPEHFVGIITEIANDWYGNTYLLLYIDDDEAQRIDYVAGRIQDPLLYTPRGIPFTNRVRWEVVNQDAVDHVIGVKVDGFYISKEDYDRLVG